MPSDLIIESARRYFERDYDLGFMRRWRASAEPDRAGLVRLCQETGWHALIVDEADGGFGYPLETLCALSEELGRAAFPSLYLSHFAVPALLVGALDDTPGRRAFLSAVARGELVPGLANPSSTMETFSGVPAFASGEVGQGYVVNGSTDFVCDLDSANLLLLPARGQDGSICVFAVPKARPGVVLVPRADQMLGTTHSVTCRDVSLEPDALLGRLAPEGMRRVYASCAVVQSARILGAAKRAMAFAISHVMMRKQFGKLLAEFQAVQHQAAEMYEAADVAGLLLREAIDRCAQGDGLASASVCKAWVNDAGFRICATSHQLMGGTGYMQETDLHLLTDLVLRAQYEFGSADYHRELIASRAFASGP